MDLHNYMIEHFQYQMTTLRPPKGEFSEKTLAITQDLGYKTIMWSYAYYDYDVNNQPDEATAHQKLIHHLHPGEILLLHAVSDTNMMILDEFIDDTLSQGYMFIKPQEKMG
jgi:peptidoglycan-N-acetylmuramic acid deacetylase